MPQRVKTQRVTFRVSNPVQLDRGIVLPPGRYAGERQEIGLETYEGVNWTTPEYKIELSADELRAFGAVVKPNLVSMNIDVSKFVRAGEIDVI